MTSRVDWVLLINAMLGSALTGLSVRIFMISLPTLAAGLKTDILGISWALISFQLASISLSIVFGRLGDIYGRRIIFTLGFLFVTISSFLCGISRNVTQLILFRFLQGVGGAMTQSVGRTLAIEAMPEGSVGRAQGYMTMAFHAGFFIGPALGGFIIEYVHWRGIFFFIVPIGLVGSTLSILRSKRASEAELRARRPSVDYAGAFLLIVLTLMLILLLDRKAAELVGISQKGFLSLAFLGMLWGFLARESRAPSPIMNLSLFRIRMFACSVVSLLTLSITRGMASLFIPFYLQDIMDISPSLMGVMFLTPPIFTFALAPLAGYMTDRIGPRTPATLGAIASTAVLVTGVGLKVDSHWILPTAMLGLMGVGTALFNSANLAALLGSVPVAFRGFANGMVHTTFDLGHMLGVSVGGLLLTLTFRYYSGIPDATPNPGEPVPFVSSLNASFGAAIAIALIALATSMMRGGGKLEPAQR